MNNFMHLDLKKLGGLQVDLNAVTSNYKRVNRPKRLLIVCKRRTKCFPPVITIDFSSASICRLNIAVAVCFDFLRSQLSIELNRVYTK